MVLQKLIGTAPGNVTMTIEEHPAGITVTQPQESDSSNQTKWEAIQLFIEVNNQINCGTVTSNIVVSSATISAVTRSGARKRTKIFDNFGSRLKWTQVKTPKSE
jgi:hypothetical protein